MRPVKEQLLVEEELLRRHYIATIGATEAQQKSNSKQPVWRDLIKHLIIKKRLY